MEVDLRKAIGGIAARQELCPQVHERRAAKLKQAILYIERNPKRVRSLTSFPYIVNSL
jgi:hypothetical protein